MTRILFRTPWQRLDDGWAVAARAYARVLVMAGCQVRLVTHQEPVAELTEEVLRECAPFVNGLQEFDLHLMSNAVTEARRMQPLTALALSSGKRAFHCVIDHQSIEPDLVSLLNKLDGVLVQNSRNEKELADAGCKNVFRTRFPYFDDDPLLELEAPTQCKRFYWIGANEPRKCPDNLIRAFLRAFKPEDECTLTLKLSQYGFHGKREEPEHVIYNELGEGDVIRNGWTAGWTRSMIRIIRGSLSTTDMNYLHAANDCYVSASRGEGLELSAFAAKLAGRRLVMTDSGGPRDYMEEGDVLVPLRGLVETHPSYMYWKGARWADYTVGDLAEAMQVAREMQVKNTRISEDFHAKNVSKKFGEWLEHLRA